MNFINKKYSRYLPSNKFLIIVGIVLIVGIAIYAIFFMASSGQSFATTGDKNNIPLKVENQTITELVQKDSDGDGVPDWEESLWGTDPNKKMTFDNMPDATYIENKKKDLKIEDTSQASDQNLTETDKFAREFFASYTAMKASGQVNKDDIDSFSNSLGQNIVDPNLIDRYKDTDLKINDNDNSDTQQQYYSDIKNLFKSYQVEGLGNELNIINKGLTSNSTDSTDYAQLSKIATAYQDFAQKAMQLSVPDSLSQYNLDIANSANNTGVSVLNMEKIVDDPIIGLSGLSQYQKYSDALVKAVGDLETALQK
jgi:hypothetical protein